ncbi:hypothetical protein LINPERPRIM_LOCUS29133 [Linum perenne]
MVAIFLVTVGHNTKNRTVQSLFHRSAETISRTIQKVLLLAILKLHDLLIEKLVHVPQTCTDGRWKHFNGCIGALDGTIIKVYTTKDVQPRHRTRKGDTGINVLAACNQNMQFMYSLAGWEGSAHNSRVLRDAISRTNGLRVPTSELYFTFLFSFSEHPNCVYLQVSITSVMSATQMQEDFSPLSEDNDTTYKNGVGIYREQLKSSIT